MKKTRRIFPLAAALVSVLVTLPAHAVFHLWTIEEIYSSADGSVQYIELATASSGEGQLSGHTVVSTDTNGTTTTFTFPANLSGDTTNTRLLLATDGFATSTGLTPDFVIPANFVPRGGSINFGEGSDTVQFTAAQLPLNGTQAMNGAGQVQIPSPTNFAGLSATPQAETLASFDAGTNVMNVPVLTVPGFGVANVSFAVDLNTVEFTLLDNFYIYANGIGAGNSPAELRDGGVLYIPGLLIGNEIYEFTLQLLGENPIRFGNPEILSVQNQEPAPAPTPEPDPEPEPDSDQESINRGQTAYANQCAVCHGSSGQGGTGPALTTSSFNTFTLLRNQIDANMPQNNPSACVDSSSSTCATDVANYVLTVIQGSLNSATTDTDVNGSY